jgi:hypothetical protein
MHEITAVGRLTTLLHHSVFRLLVHDLVSVDTHVLYITTIIRMSTFQFIRYRNRYGSWPCLRRYTCDLEPTGIIIAFTATTKSLFEHPSLNVVKQGTTNVSVVRRQLFHAYWGREFFSKQYHKIVRKWRQPLFDSHWNSIDSLVG